MFPSTNSDHFPSFNINHDPLMLTAAPTLSSFETVHMMSNDNVINNDNIKNLRDKKPSLVKKERHSKIRTAQGLRDRRVRLSTGIARKFFDLQDTLGFDKASKTLGWLLEKSRSSILELEQADATSRNSHGEHETAAEESSTNGSTLCPKIKNKLKDLSKVVSREKARERARLRTMAKMYGQSSIAQMQEIPNARVSNDTLLHNRPSTTTRVLVTAEVVTTATKDVTRSMISTSSNNYLPNLPQNWDGGGATSSSLYAKISKQDVKLMEKIGVSPQY